MTSWKDKIKQAPLCPQCEAPMILRKSARGEFYGCSSYPNCRGTRDADGKENPLPKNPASTQHAEPIIKMDGSPEQEAIWKSLLEDQAHIVVTARAGTGKTWSMIQACLRLDKKLKIAFIAFNKHIATEAQGKLAASGCRNVLCCTYHSLGLRACRAAFPKSEINDDKTDGILETLPVPFGTTASNWRLVLNLTRKLVGFAKNYLLNPDDTQFREKLEEITDHHGVEMNGIGQKALDLVPLVLFESKRTASSTIDFDDMIWLPNILELPMPQTFDVLIVDEFQDSNICQQELAMRACPTGRIVVVGDPFQAIYGFRGADTTAFPKMIERLTNTKRGAKLFPLTVTRRCPKSHVEFAQALVPDIQALDDAPAGEVQFYMESKAVEIMQAGDLALCRVNARLVSIAYDLIRRGVKPIIRGREIGKGLIELITKLEKNALNVTQLAAELTSYRYREEDKLNQMGPKAAGRLSALRDRCDCLMECIREANSIPELKSKIESLFSDFEPDGQPKNAVILGTIHRTKGLESERVFVLAPELLPHPMARQDWERVQENNLAYVAATRAKFTKTAPGTLVFCGMIPAIYEKKQAAPAAEKGEQDANVER